MNLSDNGDGMVPFNAPQQQQQQPPQSQSFQYQPYNPPPQPQIPPPAQQYQAPKNPQEKNIVKQHIAMDSTPISDIMDGPEMQDPRMVMQQDPRMINNMMPTTPMVQAASPDKKSTTSNPFNLTDKQMEAIVAGVCAIIAFSKPVQEKLSTTIPQFLSESGSTSNIGLLVTGLIAALIFYFMQKFVNKH